MDDDEVAIVLDCSVATAHIAVIGYGSLVLVSTTVVSGADGSFESDSLPQDGGALGLIQQGVDIVSDGASAIGDDVRLVLSRHE